MKRRSIKIKNTINHPPPPKVQVNLPSVINPSKINEGGIMSGVGSSIIQGFAFGTGSSLAHEAVHKVFEKNNSQENVSLPTINQPKCSINCENEYKSFMKCLQQNNNNSTSCNTYFDALQACQSRI